MNFHGGGVKGSFSNISEDYQLNYSTPFQFHHKISFTILAMFNNFFKVQNLSQETLEHRTKKKPKTYSNIKVAFDYQINMLTKLKKKIPNHF